MDLFGAAAQMFVHSWPPSQQRFIMFANEQKARRGEGEALAGTRMILKLRGSIPYSTVKSIGKPTFEKAGFWVLSKKKRDSRYLC